MLESTRNLGTQFWNFGSLYKDEDTDYKFQEVLEEFEINICQSRGV